MRNRLLERELQRVHSLFVDAVYNGHDAGKLTDEQMEGLIDILSRIDEVSEDEVRAFVATLTPRAAEEAVLESTESAEDVGTVEGEPAEGGFVDEDDPRLVWG